MALSLVAAYAGYVVNVPVPPPPHQLPSAVTRPVLGDFVPRPPSVSSSGLIFPASVELPSTLVARASSGNFDDFDIGSMFDDIPSTSSDSDRKAAALRAETEQAEVVKAARAEKAIARMALEDERKVREAEAIAASGVPICETSVWGSGSTGLLSAKACARVRDGVVDQKEVSLPPSDGAKPAPAHALHFLSGAWLELAVHRERALS